MSKYRVEISFSNFTYKTVIQRFSLEEVEQYVDRITAQLKEEYVVDIKIKELF